MRQSRGLNRGGCTTLGEMSSVGPLWPLAPYLSIRSSFSFRRCSLLLKMLIHCAGSKWAMKEKKPAGWWQAPFWSWNKQAQWDLMLTYRHLKAPTKRPAVSAVKIHFGSVGEGPVYKIILAPDAWLERTCLTDFCQLDTSCSERL